MIDLQDVKFVKSDDWQQLYINGNLMVERHSISAEDLLDALDVYYTVEYTEED